MSPFHTRYLLSIITAHVKKSEPELETVLLKIKELRGKQADRLTSRSSSLEMSQVRM